ncbi:hypothetical protein [Sphingomonas sp.]|uniref:hypothetical protein n=1 Tax=Sphingomonas sp. TaxID=28214 RepID=UPI00286DF483|nr:hypothetical protein [Sphingomonas sp.]
MTVKHGLYAIGLAAAALAITPAAAQRNPQSGPTVGDCISDGIYGNEPNMANGAPGGPAEQAPGSQAGNVLPSQSPGPFVTNPDGSVRRGSSVGDFNQQFGGGAVPEFCRTLTDL